MRLGLMVDEVTQVGTEERSSHPLAAKASEQGRSLMGRLKFPAMRQGMGPLLTALTRASRAAWDVVLVVSAEGSWLP